MAETQRIAFIGLGNMGIPMAINLAKAGHRVTGFDLSLDTCGKARELGLSVASSAHKAIEDATTVVPMLPASRHVESLYLGEAGLIDAIGRTRWSSTAAPFRRQWRGT
jgi:3-hydroxyisobutyrate dehydrogenase